MQCESEKRRKKKSDEIRVKLCWLFRVALREGILRFSYIRQFFSPVAARVAPAISHAEWWIQFTI